MGVALENHRVYKKTKKQTYVQELQKTNEDLMNRQNQERIEKKLYLSALPRMLYWWGKSQAKLSVETSAIKVI